MVGIYSSLKEAAYKMPPYGVYKMPDIKQPRRKIEDGNEK
jgi:hypothetical protein